MRCTVAWWWAIETRHFLVKCVEMRFEESQFLEGQLEEPPVDGMEGRAGAERVTQLVRGGP